MTPVRIEGSYRRGMIYTVRRVTTLPPVVVQVVGPRALTRDERDALAAAA